MGKIQGQLESAGDNMRMQTKIINNEEVRFSDGVVMGPEMIEHPPLRCKHGKIALTVVNGIGYCADERAEAVAATTKLSSKRTGRNRMDFIA